MAREYVSDPDEMAEDVPVMKDDDGDWYVVDQVNKRRRYVDDISEVPEWANPQEGRRGGYYYDTDDYDMSSAAGAEQAVEELTDNMENLSNSTDVRTAIEDVTDTILGDTLDNASVDEKKEMLETMVGEDAVEEGLEFRELDSVLEDKFASALFDMLRDQNPAPEDSIPTTDYDGVVEDFEEALKDLVREAAGENADPEDVEEEVAEEAEEQAEEEDEQEDEEEEVEEETEEEVETDQQEQEQEEETDQQEEEVDEQDEDQEDGGERSGEAAEMKEEVEELAESVANTNIRGNVEIMVNNALNEMFGDKLEEATPEEHVEVFEDGFYTDFDDDTVEYYFSGIRGGSIDTREELGEQLANEGTMGRRMMQMIEQDEDLHYTDNFSDEESEMVAERVEDLTTNIIDARVDEETGEIEGVTSASDLDGALNVDGDYTNHAGFDGRGNTAELNDEGEVELNQNWNTLDDFATVVNHAAMYESGQTSDELSDIASKIKDQLPLSPDEPFDEQDVQLDPEELEMVYENIGSAREYRARNNYPEDDIEQIRYERSMVESMLGEAQQDAIEEIRGS